MPYISVTYPGPSTKPYTFYTAYPNIKPGEIVLVKDRKGYSVCTAGKYVNKPSFPCSVVLFTKTDLVEQETGIRDNMENEDEYEDEYDDLIGDWEA